MWSTELGVFFFPSLPPTLYFARAQVRFLGTWTSVRTVYASFLASTITSSGVLVPLTGSPVATTPSCLDLTIRFFQLGCEIPVSQNWGYDNNNWLCPPVCLIVRVVRHMKLCRAQGTLVLPLWSQLFSGMPLIEMECTGIALLSTGYICLSSRGYLFQQGLQFPFRIQALRFWLRSAWSQFSVPQISLLPGRLLLYAWRKVLPVLVVACYAYTFRSGAIKFCT